MTISRLLAIGALSVGLAACGSDSSSDSTGSQAAVVKKEAGLLLDVQLTVVNDTPNPVSVKLCPASTSGVGDCVTHDLAAAQPGVSPHPEAHLTAERVNGTFLTSPQHVSFTAVNPPVSPPFINLEPGDGFGYLGNPTASLVEGEVTPVKEVGDQRFVLSRPGDTSVKMLVIELRP